MSWKPSDKKEIEKMLSESSHEDILEEAKEVSASWAKWERSIKEKRAGVIPPERRHDEMFDTDFDRAANIIKLDQENENATVQLKKRLDEIAVDHPSHYNQGKIEVKDFIRDQDLNFSLGNAVKYICRSRHKGVFKEDLRKAIFYLQDELGEKNGEG